MLGRFAGPNTIAEVGLANVLKVAGAALLLILAVAAKYLLPFLLRLSKATTRTINQNLLLFGLLFNATMLALSGLGLLTPIMGAIGHNLGSVAVVLNSARLLRYRT